MRSNTLFLLAPALFALLAIPAAAESAPAILSVEQAVQSALLNNLSLKSAALEARAKKREKDFSINTLYPTVSASATASRTSNPSAQLLGDSYGAASGLGAGEVTVNSATYYYGVDQDSLALTLSIQEVFSVSALLSMSQTALAYQTSALNREKAEKQIIATTRETFYQLLVQKEAIALTRARLDSASERMRQAKVSMELGKGTELDYLNAQSNVESLIPELRGMELSRKAALAAFQELLGFDDRPDMELLGALDDEPMRAIEREKPVATRFDILSSELSVKNLESALKIQSASLLPALILQYKADPALNDPSSFNRVFSYDNWSQSSGGLSLTLSWSLSSLIPGSGYYLKQQELRERLALERENERQTRTSAEKEVKLQLEAIRASLDKIGNLQNAAAAASRAYELTDAAYRSGSGRYLDLKSAEISAQGSQMQLLNERLNLIKLLYDLDAEYRD